MSAPIPNRPILSAVLRTQDDDDDKLLLEALKKIASQDPTVEVRLGPSEDAAVVAVKSLAHLAEIVECLRVEYGVQAVIADLKALFLETIRKKAEAEGKYIRQAGGSGNYGHCWLRIEPNEPGKGHEFVNDVKGGTVPKEYIKPSIRACRELLNWASWPASRWSM